VFEFYNKTVLFYFHYSFNYKISKLPSIHYRNVSLDPLGNGNNSWDPRSALLGTTDLVYWDFTVMAAML
jgi:hypothetical protein